MTEQVVVSSVAVREPVYNPFRAAPIVSAIIIVWVFLLHVSPGFFHMFPTPLGLFEWRLVATVVLIAMLFAEAKKFSSGEEMEEEAEGEQKRVPKKNQVDYPPKITGVIYADTYIPLDDDKEVKIRTMLARACPLCDKEQECWESASSRMSKTDFRSNMECKEGLREIGAK